MDVKEKLVELLLQEDGLCKLDECKDCNANGSCYYYRAADRIIAHGATLQEWISVKDRLPAVGEDVLVITSSSDRNMAVWRLFGNAENRQAHWEDEVGDGLVLGAATHWMPLPQPPKGE